MRAVQLPFLDVTRAAVVLTAMVEESQRTQGLAVLALGEFPESGPRADRKTRSMTPTSSRDRAVGNTATGSDGPGASVFVRDFSDLDRFDVAWAGGKGANLGELRKAGLPVPPGFVIGAEAYAAFCGADGLRTRIGSRLQSVDVSDQAALGEASAQVRKMVEAEPIPVAVSEAIQEAYGRLSNGVSGRSVAVRSSATAEDTEEASFAGMNETFLNVRGSDAVVDAVRRAWASLFGARTIYYRAARGFGHADMDIAVVVQAQIASTRAGVMFTIDPATGATDQIVIESSLGLGEAVVSGQVSPDRYVVDKESLSLLKREIRRKDISIDAQDGGGTRVRDVDPSERMLPSLTDDEARAIAELGRRIERHYGSPQDTEWCIDEGGSVWMLQSRPVTAFGGDNSAVATSGVVLLRGLGAAPGVGRGPVRILESTADAGRLNAGDVLVTHMTAPDWVPLMRRAAAVVTETGGMTCHAAIVSRELGVPCVVGTVDARSRLSDGMMVTVDAGPGLVLEGTGPPQLREAIGGPLAPAIAAQPATGTLLLLNLSEPSQVARASALEVDGVGLLRAELMLIEALDGVHPLQLIEEGRGPEVTNRMAAALESFTRGFAPRPITYRTIDFRTNEFRGLRGGERFEPVEANPMIGYRGALRYTREPDLLRLELDAVARVWDAGQQNLHVMLPFVRTTRELATCVGLVADAGLMRRRGFELWVMAEVPSVLFNLAEYAALGVAGISIGSNDLTQLLLGADRDSDLLADVFDERDPAVVAYLRQLISAARALGLRTSICGQAPSVHAEYADILVRAGIDAVSVSTDAVDRTRRLIAAAERRVILEAARGSGAPTRNGGQP
jgi:pyruvate, water dikinase